MRRVSGPYAEEDPALPVLSPTERKQRLSVRSPAHGTDATDEEDDVWSDQSLTDDERRLSAASFDLHRAESGVVLPPRGKHASARGGSRAWRMVMLCVALAIFAVAVIMLLSVWRTRGMSEQMGAFEHMVTRQPLASRSSLAPDRGAAKAALAALTDAPIRASAAAAAKPTTKAATAMATVAATVAASGAATSEQPSAGALSTTAAPWMAVVLATAAPTTAAPTTAAPTTVAPATTAPTTAAPATATPATAAPATAALATAAPATVARATAAPTTAAPTTAVPTAALAAADPAGTPVAERAIEFEPSEVAADAKDASPTTNADNDDAQNAQKSLDAAAASAPKDVAAQVADSDSKLLLRIADGVRAATDFPRSALGELLLRNATAPHCVGTPRQLCDGTKERDWFPTYKVLHPWIGKLEEGMDKLFGELHSVEDQHFIPFAVRDGNAVASDAGASSMEFFPLFVLGNTMFKNTEMMRHSWNFLQQLGIPGLLNVGFQQLAPGEKATPSCSLQDGLLYTRIVMAIQVPESTTPETMPRMQVCGGMHTFKVGRSIGFNNSFPMEVVNPGKTPLRLLLIDIVQPKLLTSATYQAVVHKLSDEWAPLFETMKSRGIKYADTLQHTLWEQAGYWEMTQKDLLAQQLLVDHALATHRDKDELR